MDKIRPGTMQKRPGKLKGHTTPFDLIPLGKSRESEQSGSKLAAAVKRDAHPSSSSSLLAKLPKYGSPRPESPNTKYDDMAIECAPTELLDKIQAEKEDTDFTDKLLCGAIKQLRLQRAKPNQQLMLTLMYLVKSQPDIFNTDIVTGALCSLLQRDPSISFKAKGNLTVSVLACNLLYTAYINEDDWPQQLIKVYLDDSLGERVWVDRQDCKPLVDNILTAFNTNLTPKKPLALECVLHTLPGSTSAGSSSSPSHSPFHTNSVEGEDSNNPLASTLITSTIVKDRYRLQTASIKQLVTDVITEHTTKRQHIEVSNNKQFLKLLTNVSGYCAVRLLAVSKLELWLQNPKLMKVAQDLLLSVCLNCSGEDPNDKDVIVGLLKMRFKNKQLISHYIACIKELLENDEENLRIALTHTIYNELSATKNQNNMQILSIMFQQDQQRTPKLLATIFLDLLMSKDDYLRALRGLLREIVRTLRHDFTFHTFCASLMEDRSAHPVFIGLEQPIKERVMFAITDLVAACELLTITPAIREAGTSTSWGDKRKDAAVMQTFWSQVAAIQCDAVVWMSDVFTVMLPQVENPFFLQCLHKLLMMAQTEHYCGIDNWPAEQDRALMLRLASETPVLEDTIIRILMMGMESSFPLKASDALDVVNLMVNKAASLNTYSYPVLSIKNIKIVDLLLSISTYHHPDNIKLPQGYKPPHLAVSAMYWKSWLLLLIISAYNPTTFAKYIWKDYPTLEMMMEMVMTNTYTFPPVSSSDKSDSILAKERQIYELEKQEILEFEGYLAAATSNVTITESNSLLLTLLISMNSIGPARRPPPNVLEDLQILNSTIHIGQRLSKSRNPDFLMQVIQKQGTSNAMPWLLELVESNEGSLDVLPIQCLCEFLLIGNDSSKYDEPKLKPNQKITRHDKLLQRLQAIIQQSPNSDGQQTAIEVIEFFFKRLYNPSPDIRSLSFKALQVMFADPVTQQAMEIDIDMEINQFEWLIDNIPELEIYGIVEKLIQECLHKALQVELEGDIITAYLSYLLESKMYRKEPSYTILELSIMLTQRPSVCKLLLNNAETFELLLRAYNDFTDDAIQRAVAFSWADKDLAVMVQWTDEKVAELDLRVIHAVVMLLCHKTSQDYITGKQLLELWFPESGELPDGFLASSSELADLYTDKLRRDMLQTGLTVLLNAALSDLKLKQLLVFIQSFGLPVNTVNILLDHIDKACENESKTVKKAIQSQKPYLQQLMETQRLRGVTSGVVFSKLLGDSSESMETESTPPPKIVKNSSAARTLSMLESRPHKTVGADIDDYVNKTLLNPELCKEGFMVAQKSAVSSKHCKQQIAEALVRVLAGEDKSKFIASMHKAGNSSTALLRLLLSDPGSTHSKQLYTLLSSCNDLPKSVSGFVNSAKPKFGVAAISSNNAEQELNGVMVQLCLDDKRLKAADVCLNKIQAIINGSEDKSTLGLIVDWLQLIDPELNTLSSEGQDQLLFGNNCIQSVDGTVSNQSADGTVSSQSAEIATNSQSAEVTTNSQLSNISGPSYLRSLLIHQSRWTTVRQTINRLLTADRLKIWNPTSVLDFLTACIHHPRLYQGREAKRSKSVELENILSLSLEQIESLTELITLEVEKSGDTAVSVDRTDLLLQCCLQEEQLEHLIHFIEYKSSQAGIFGVIYRNLLLLLYTQQPKLIHWLGDSSILYHDMTSALTGSCVLDPEIHAALTTLGTVKAGKKCALSIADANLVCRKLASLHPILFMRHLSTLSSLLSGRCNVAFGEFLNRNYLLLHTCVLGLVELLQPHIFVQKDFPDIIDAFFNVIKVHGHENDDTMSALFVKFISLLCNFFTCLPDSCVKIMHQYKDLLSLLQNDSRYNRNPGLKALATASYMPQAKEKTSDSDTVKGMILQSSTDNITFTHEQLKSTLRKLVKTSTTEDMLSALNDLDATSKKVVDVLGRCLDEFKALMFCANQQVREATFKLIKRYACHNPRATKEFLIPMIACLDHDNTDISKTALSYVADIALLMTEDDRERLLDSAFYAAALHNDDDGIKNLRDIVRIVSTNVFLQS